MKQSATVARVPKVGNRTIRDRLHSLVDFLCDSFYEPLEDVPTAVSKIAHLCEKFRIGERKAIIAQVRARASALRSSEDHDDLIAAGELDDLAEDLELPFHEGPPDAKAH